MINKNLGNVHRFGFQSVEQLEAEGEKLVAGALEWMEKYPEVARY